MLMLRVIYYIMPYTSEFAISMLCAVYGQYATYVICICISLLYIRHMLLFPEKTVFLNCINNKKYFGHLFGHLSRCYGKFRTNF